MDLKNKHKITYYYMAGAFTLLLALKLLSSKIFKDMVDLSITYLPFIIIILVGISSWKKYKKSPNNEEVKHSIRKDALIDTFLLLLITLIFYILYSPASFTPITEAANKIGEIVSMETYFLFLSYLSIAIVFFSVSFLAFKAYQKTKGTYDGSVSLLTKKTLYTLFFVFAFFFVSSIFTYPKAYAPITNQLGRILGSIFYPAGDDRTLWERVSNARMSSLRTALSQTYDSLKNNLSTSADKLTETITDTKASLDGAIARTNKDLKVNLSGDISDKFDTSGGTIEGDLTIEEELTVESTAYLRDVIPDSDDSYDLGSVSKGWENVYIHALHGSSILTIGDGATSHGITDTDDLLVAGDLEVNGDIYFDSQLDMNSNKIVNLADPTDAQDAVTKAYYEANTPAGVFSRSGTEISPTNTGDDLNMLANPILNIGANGTDFDSSGALALAGGLTISSLATGLLEVNSGVVGLAAAGTDYENPLTFSNSLSRATNTVTLVNDSAAPGNSKFYGTNGSGTRGWYDISAGVTDHAALSNLAYALSGHTGFEPTITAGTTAQYLRGDKSLATLDTSAVSGLGTIATQDSNAVSITGGSASGITQLTVDNIDLNGNTISTSTGDLVLDPNASSDVDLAGSELINIGNSGTDFNSSGGLTLAAALDMSETNINNVGSIGLDSIAADDGTISAAFGSNDFNVDSNTLVVEGDDNQVGIGTASPASILELSSSAAHPILTVTGADNSAYDPQIQFRTDATPTVKFSLGVDAGDSDKFKIAAGTAGIGDTSNFMIDTNGITYINSLQSGAQNFETDAGIVQWADMPVTSAASGTVESYSAMLDGTAALTIYGTSNGSGGLTAGPYVGIGTTTPAYGLDYVGTNGMVRLRDVETDATTKVGRMAVGHYTNSEEPLYVFGAASVATENYLGFGGGSTLANAATQIDFYTAANTTTVTGTSRMVIESNGYIGINDATPDGLLDVEPTGVVTAASYGINLSNLTTNATTDGINKYGTYITSTGNWPGSSGTATNNYGLYINTTAGADNNYDIYAASGANLTTAGTWTNAPSYRRYKDKVGDASGYLDKLMALDIDEWQYKDDKIDGMNRYQADPNRHASPYLDDFYNVFRLGTDKGVNTQDLAGVALASVKELNTRFINENSLTDEDIAGITLKTDENATTVLELKDSVDDNLAIINEQLTTNSEQLADINSQVADYESRIADLETLSQTLQTQILELQQLTNQELNIAQIGANADDTAFIKTLLGTERAENVGDINILGKVTAEELVVNGVSTGKITVNITGQEAPTIGEGEIVAITKDEDGDGVDDETGTNGKSVEVSTKAVTENSKVFVTPKSATADPLAVTEVRNGESFKAEVAAPVAENLKFDWWIVDVKDEN